MAGARSDPFGAAVSRRPEHDEKATDMKLNHVNLTVSDVPAASAFLETYLGLRSVGGNAGMAFVVDDDGSVIALMKAGRAAEASYPANFHIGFFVGSESEVDALHRRLAEAGFEVTTPERHHGYTFYVKAPGGFTIELGGVDSGEPPA